MLAAIVVVLLLSILITLAVSGAGEGLYGLGLAWIPQTFYILAIVLVCLRVLGIQYTSRDTRRARLFFGSAGAATQSASRRPSMRECPKGGASRSIT